MGVSTHSASSLVLAFALLGVLYPSSVTADLVLNEKIMKLSKIAAELSVLSYAEDPPNESAYDSFGFFDDEPDQALVAQKMGYCFAAFRGTTLTADDWRQNFKLGNEEVCKGSKKGDEQCCSTRTGYFQAYNTAYKNDMEDAIRACAKDCLNPDECVVLTGHSQGGAVAAVAALFLSDLNPYVITFGQPATVDQPCPLITSERYYRYVNSKDSVAGRIHGVSYDPVPFTPGLGADSFGHLILLSSDTTGVAYIGLDAQDSFHPLDLKAEAHSMGGVSDSDTLPGYLDRIKAIMHAYSRNQTYPVRTSGYVAGTLCSEGKECESTKCEKDTTFAYSRCVGVECKEDKDCDTGRCDSGLCLPKLGSCVACNEDTDCAGNHCLQFRCSGENGLMDDNCNCNLASDCNSGRCEGLAPPVCEAQLGIGSKCNEDSDCRSEYCSWGFLCDTKLLDGMYCTSSSDCQSNHCSWRFRCYSPMRLATSLKASLVSENTEQVVAEMTGPQSSGAHFGMVTAGFLFLTMNAVMIAYNRFSGRRDGYEEVPTALSV
jgi:pimeloyl-ACP methyl ester carboxylesterase